MTITIYKDNFKIFTPEPLRYDVVAEREIPAGIVEKYVAGRPYTILIPTTYTENTTKTFTVPAGGTLSKTLPKLYQESVLWGKKDSICVEDITNGEMLIYEGSGDKKFSVSGNTVTITNNTAVAFDVTIYYLPSAGEVEIVQQINSPQGTLERRLGAVQAFSLLHRDIAETPVGLTDSGELVRSHKLLIKAKPRTIGGTPLFEYTPLDSRGNVLPILYIEMSVDS
jgi:hypothetical protein